MLIHRYKSGLTFAFVYSCVARQVAPTLPAPQLVSPIVPDWSGEAWKAGDVDGNGGVLRPLDQLCVLSCNVPAECRV